MMDAKALAKSKRAHSLHHKKKHQSHQAFKEPSVGSDEKNPTGKQAKEKPLQSQLLQANERQQKSHGTRPLPSNWGCYDGASNLSPEEVQTSSSQPAEVVVPKSKGADYTHLISEAKAESQVHYSRDDAPLFDDFINDFTQDFGPMLAAKGQSMLSWTADDGFEFEGMTSTSFEAPFLSLKLNALAQCLAKAKLSERLYLGQDLFPPELLDDELMEHDEDKHNPQAPSYKAESNSGSSSLSYNQEAITNVQQHHEPSSSPVTVPEDIPTQSSEEELKPVKQDLNGTSQSKGTHRSISPESVPESTLDSISVKPPTFEAASAEDELDMLLSSFGETKILEPSGASSLSRIPSTAAISGENAKKGNIDDDIDNLLKETSDLTISKDKCVSHGLKVNSETVCSTVDRGSKSKLLDDFDSWLDTI